MNYRSINSFVIRFFAVVALIVFSACDFNNPDADSLTGFQNEDDGISYNITGFHLTGPEALSKVTTTNPFELPGDAKVYLVYSNVTEVNPYENRYYMGTVGDLRGSTPAPVTIPVTVGKQDKLTTLEIVHPAYEHGVMLPCMYGLQFDDDRIGDNGYVEPTGLLQTNAPGLRRTHMNNWKLNYNENGELAFIQEDNMANMVLGAVYYDALGDSIRDVSAIYGSGFCDSEKYAEMGPWDAPIPQESQMIDLQATYTLGYRTGMWYTNVEVNGNTIPVRWSLAPMVKGQSAYYALTGGYNAEMRWHGVKLVSINGGHPNMTDAFPLHHIDPVDMVGNGSTFSALTVTAGQSGYSQSENNLIYTFGTGGGNNNVCENTNYHIFDDGDTTRVKYTPDLSRLHATLWSYSYEQALLLCRLGVIAEHTSDPNDTTQNAEHHYQTLEILHQNGDTTEVVVSQIYYDPGTGEHGYWVFERSDIEQVLALMQSGDVLLWRAHYAGPMPPAGQTWNGEYHSTHFKLIKGKVDQTWSWN
ncbi:MAG: hypothetical protein ACPGO5_01855 [Patescibacteria group bacterium]